MAKTLVTDSETAPVSETHDAQHARLAWEATRVEEALADLRDGQTIPHEAMKAWVESWNTPDERSPPEPGHEEL